MVLLEPIDELVDHVECGEGERVRFAFRYYPLTDIHPHALAAAAAIGG